MKVIASSNVLPVAFSQLQAFCLLGTRQVSEDKTKAPRTRQAHELLPLY
jgi:hypothetical protein